MGRRTLTLAWYFQALGLNSLSTQALGQRFQSGQILDLQVIEGYVAVLDGLAIELIEKILEDIVDAYACEKVPLLNSAVKTVRNEALVATDREKDKTWIKPPALKMWPHLSLLNEIL